MAARTVIVALLVILAPAAAQAQPGASSPSSDGESTWYGGHILVVDGVGVGLGLAGLAGHDSAFLPGTAVMVLGAPILHAVHGNGGRTALSLGMRVLLPLAGAAIGDSLIDDCDPDCHPPDFTGMIAGGMIGMVAASIIDIMLLAHERPRRHDSDGVAWTPQLGITGSEVSAGIGGTF